MPCACQGNQTKEPEPEFVVKLPDGSEMTVSGEYEARVAVTRAGGGSYRRK